MIAQTLISSLLFFLPTVFGGFAYARRSEADYGYMDGGGSSALGSGLFDMLLLLLICFLVYWFIRERELRKYIFIIFVVLGLVALIWNETARATGAGAIVGLAGVGGVIWLGFIILREMFGSDTRKSKNSTEVDVNTHLHNPEKNILDSRTKSTSSEGSTKPKVTKFFHRELPKDASMTVRGRYRKAMAGDPVAQFLLGQHYEMGDGVEDHYIEAVGWYKESAEQGNPEAQLKLALLLKSGLGVHKDVAQAKSYAQSAANSGHHFSEDECRLLDELLNPLVEDLPAGINPINSLPSAPESEVVKKNPDKRLESNMTQEADPETLFRRGVDLEIGKFGQVDHLEAAKLYLAAAKKGHKKAQFNLSLLYRKGLGVEKNDLEANKWLDLSNH
jgi:hypothetical protein